MAQGKPSSILITDFDGTMTEHDFYELVAARCLRTGTPDYWSQYTSGVITHFEAMRAIYRAICCDAETLKQIVRSMELDPDLYQSVVRLRRAGWDVEIVSGGCLWYIEHLLSDAGVDVKVYSNPGRFVPGQGLLMELPSDAGFLSESTGIDKEALVRDAVGRYGQVAFAGNGPPDLAPALLVDKRLRFARGWLAEELSRRAQLFRPFTRWSEIARKLAKESP